MMDQVRASHILLAFAGAQNSSVERSREEALAEIGNLKTQIDGGADFAELATAHSDCPSSGQGGDLGDFGRGMMVPEFETAAFSMDIDAVSDVVETAFGYHLIQRTA